MPKIAFLGAGSTVFAKSVLGDVMCAEPLRDSHLALYDIDATRLAESQRMLETLNANVNAGRATITAHCGPSDRPQALRGADYVVNAVQVGGYEPCTVIDFEVPKKYGLRQTIGDTLGIGGIMRGLRTTPVLLEMCRDMEELCPEVTFLNYVNPMAINTWAINRASSINTVGLCHSVPHTAASLGYLVYNQREKLLEEYLGLASAEIVELKKQGQSITRTISVPFVCYLGDVELEKLQWTDLMRQARILVIECTFFEDGHQHRARYGKHVHLDDLLELLPGLQSEYVVLTHLSRRTDMRKAKQLLAAKFKPEQRNRIHFFMAR